ncbi:hypothetical protein FE257_006648 [Aspergillus nanangensis]|uniref:Glycosyl hydrolase n=1 Tax=Aspergillus nanangensis TaxID=2582783 RepID=A0AAD4CYF5_ASPNN|nr:hypothetical protein FE257_006648 [Aspergillus nanangensis]
MYAVSGPPQALRRTGTENGGNNFPGVARPFGMVKLGPDLLKPGTDAYSGYLPDGEFSGFSMMHEQGTGGAPKYGTVAQLPLVGNVSQPLSNKTVARSGTDEASVGYYKAQTAQGVAVELSATAHAGIYRYSFPTGSVGNVLVDVSHVLPSFRGQGLSQGYKGGDIRIFADGHYEGHGVYDNGWNRSPDWSIYFCGYFDSRPVRNKTYTGTDIDGSVEQTSGSASSTSDSVRVGGLYTFRDTVVTSRVGISWISTEKACSNVQSEIPGGTKFQSVVLDAQSEWDSRVLSTMTTTSTNETSLSLLYTSLYFMHLIPTNQTGENPNWDSPEPYYQDIFTFWDLFRCSTALLQILQPTAYEEFIRSLIDIWRFDGYLPDARSSNYNGRTQGGSNADNVLADAYVKGVRGAIDWTDAYKAMVQDAEVVPANTPVDPMAPDSSTKEGRGALPDWLHLGFITPRFSRAVSRAVEYACNDFALHQVAAGLGREDDAERMFNLPYLYHYLDRPDLSVLQARQVAKTNYHTGRKGLPGNSDAGAMQTWLLWNMMGLYPITGQTTFLIHSPWFESLTVQLGEGKQVDISTVGGDGNGDSQIHVQRLRVNGVEWRKNWLSWDDIFAHGGTLDFELGESPSDWFDGEVPPSPAS